MYLTTRDRVQYEMFQSAFKWALRGGETTEMAFAGGIVASSDDAYNRIASDPDRAQALEEYTKIIARRSRRTVRKCN